MKLNLSGPEVEASGVQTKGKFGIGNMGFILHLLRSKVYSDIIKAVVQEYLCNGRDSHRVKGNPEKPLQVFFPNPFEQTWRCRDFGTSITPEDMTAVFILYGESTKRTDDLQTGGYGIGCKTGFGYTDSFLVNTFKDGIVRHYSCYLDESKCGELALLGESATDEPDGTEIVIPVKSGDINRFKEETVKATEFWEVRPEIVDGKIPYRNLEQNAAMKGDDWFITTSDASTTIRLIIDGIEYPYMERPNIPFRLGYNAKIYMKFPTGQIPVAVNREQVEVDEHTAAHIKTRLLKIQSDLFNSVKTAIDSCTNYIDASLKLTECCDSIGMAIPKDYTWNGKPLYGSTIRPNAATMTYYRPSGKTKKARKYSQGSLKLGHDTAFVETTRAFDAITEAGAVAIFNAIPNIQTIQMVRWSSDGSKEDFPGLDFLDFDAYYKPKIRKAALSRLIFYKFAPNLHEFRQVSAETFEKDENKKVWCRVRKIKDDYRYTNDPSNKSVMLYKGAAPWKNNRGIYGLLNFIGKDVSLYAFADTIPDERVHDVMEGLNSFEDTVAQLVEEEGIDCGEILYTKEHNFDSNYFFDSVLESDLIKAMDALPDTSVMKKYLNDSKRLRAKVNRLAPLEILAPVFADTVISKAYGTEVTNGCETLAETYPMLKFFSKAYGRAFSTLATDDVLQYVRLVESVATP